MEVKAMQEDDHQATASMHKDGKESLVSKTVAELKGIPTKEDLRRLLEHKILEVDFTKLNGDKRTMTCTLRSDVRPTLQNNSTSKKTLSDSTISVWDVNACGWRSFRYERVNSIRAVDEANKFDRDAARDK